jgi:hypothetical protein
MMIAEIADIPKAHYHHIYWIWVLFVVGMAMHWLLQVWRISQDTKTPMLAVINKNLVPVAFRSFVDLLIFAGIWQHPDILAQIAGFFGHPVTPDETAVFSIPMNNVLAAAYGVGLDSLIGYLPWLKSQLPPLTIAQATVIARETNKP